MSRVEPLREGDPAAVGPYRLLGRLGAGGQGVVYLGQGHDGRPVAVKVLREGLADERFAKEIDAARRVEPFCIAQVLDASLSGRPYIVTEYVEGPTLQEAGRHVGADLQRLAVATATALAAIHQAGVVHRDFKPANVLLGQGGPRVIDFGIARSVESGLTASSSIVGTPAYMAPEQLAGAPLGPAVDVFAWASVIVFAATGSPPFGEDSLPAVINRILHNEPQLGDLPQPLRAIVLGCLAKDPAHRPTMREVLLRLLGGQAPRLPDGAGGHASSTVPGRRRGNRTAVIASVSGVGALAVAGAVAWGATSVWDFWEPRPSTQPLALTTTGTPTPTKTKTPQRPKTKSPAKPTVKQTPKPTPTPTVKLTRTTPKPTASPSRRSSGSGSFRIVWVRVIGPRHADSPDCVFNHGNISGLVEGTKLATDFRYEWVLDGKVVSRSESVIAESHTQQVIGPLVQTNGPHRVTLRLTSPQAVSKPLSFTICPSD
ncbi:serine/threonine-protein kinase [Nonomuraea sp. NEAU-A123]|uniref:serine/threonine-protein kinase n=1 Tax=Nonomuraea sp. NEAU-A123 TaxID=2839649 RepID=UPI001BE4BE87|nr:serine/threonine-protein kinase [Nonomuraea sp. NEAU-A123]MBT2229462.1 serine/threonine protein kinase [Nonomuraea sp. NEAU-A123]